MGKSLADQLASAGLVDEKKLKKAQQEQRKKGKKAKKEHASERRVTQEEQQARLAKQRAEQAERDRKLNEERLEARRQKALRAELRQLLTQNAIPRDGDIRFHFPDPRSGKVKQMYVSRRVQEQLAAGLLAICADGERFVLVPAEVADRVAERVAEAVIFRVDPGAEADAEDDPYKDHPVPDDLMW